MIKTIKINKKVRKIVFFVIIFVIFFAIFYYKNFLYGNNISKNRINNKIEKILKNMNNYSADLKVTVKSNKTENNYIIHQEVNNEMSMQEVLEGEDIAGIKFELKNNNLRILNSKLNLEKIYPNYQNLFNNALFLDSFSKDYLNEKNEVKIYEEKDEIIMEVLIVNNKNTYIKHKKLYIDRKSLVPIKLEIKSNLKNETISIIYSNIEI